MRDSMLSGCSVDRVAELTEHEPLPKNAMLKTIAMSLIVGCVSVGCSTESQLEPAQSITMVAGSHLGMCGCSIEAIGHCGNYVEVAGEFVELIHPDLGAMHFCEAKEKGVTVEVTGELKDGKVVAESFEVIK